MLVLSRKQDQQVIINGNIIITILRVGGNTVRIGIEAPGEIGIRRAELVLTSSANSVATKSHPS